MEGCRRSEVKAKCLVKFREIVGYKLRSSIRDDFLGHAMVTVDLTYEGFDDVSSAVLLLEGYYPDE